MSSFDISKLQLQISINCENCAINFPNLPNKEILFAYLVSPISLGGQYHF